MRCFIAIQCPDDLKEGLVKVQQEVMGFGKMKLVEKENIHMTVKFLGDVDEGKVGGIKRALSFLNDTEKFEISLKNIGVFPKPEYVRVVWAGVEKGSENVDRIQGLIDDALAPLGFKKDEKFHPHFTLARVRFLEKKSELGEFLRVERGFGNFTVEKIQLMESQLTPKGPVYSPIDEFSLR